MIGIKIELFKSPLKKKVLKPTKDIQISREKLSGFDSISIYDVYQREIKDVNNCQIKDYVHLLQIGTNVATFSESECQFFGILRNPQLTPDKNAYLRYSCLSITHNSFNHLALLFYYFITNRKSPLHFILPYLIIFRTDSQYMGIEQLLYLESLPNTCLILNNSVVHYLKDIFGLMNDQITKLNPLLLNYFDKTPFHHLDIRKYDDKVLLQVKENIVNFFQPQFRVLGVESKIDGFRKYISLYGILFL